MLPFHSAQLETAGMLNSLDRLARAWCDFQKFPQLRQFSHVARSGLEAAFQLTNAVHKFGAEPWAYRDSGQSFAGRGNACRSHFNIPSGLMFEWLGPALSPAMAWPVRSL
jgi:hypothetical protein